ncbi:hypothetical protein BGX38DRAFT_1176724 [Terfezia claveryi]|nr:hypothetical protein BGX38DRAFT_1176724 [Terfezia claveryi]
MATWCYDTCYRSIRPNMRHAVTAPDTLANTGETAPATVAQPKYIPTALLTSPIDPPPHERTLLKKQDFKATHSVVPLPSSLTTPLAWYLQAEPCLSAGTAIEIPVLQSDPSPATMVTISRGEFATLQCLNKYLETHSLFHTYVGPNQVTVLCIINLPPFEYLELYNLFAPQLDNFRIKIDFYDTTLIMRRPSHTHESGSHGWISLGSLLRNKMAIIPEVKSYISWHKGQIDVNLPPSHPAIPTLVLETGYSQTPGEVHIVAKSWLWRLVRNEIEALEDHAVQCVIVLKINENLTKHWLPAFRDLFKRQDFNISQDLAPDLASYLSEAALKSIAITVEIWRNQTDTTTGALKREPTLRNRPTCTIPACISKHIITTKEIFSTCIWDYLSEVRQGTNDTFDTLQEHPPISRSTVSTGQQNRYFTLYLDDLTSPEHIPQNRRGTVWVNVPIKEWDLTDGRETLWLVPGQTRTTGIEDGGFYDNSGTNQIKQTLLNVYH